ncbi:hypothetical protein JYP52_19870 [Nitratireductor aquibiodomus]|uniref:hypothetical protein n=1 Tax=Nitratireductor aquibiodomus TaxID=204799 RepID=UPI0019D34582|nr:hypothetical protein [Nitratireductor aquibiodomus]MBN7763406.1 hypothetical protein [Nitratireductor aquibiodomus]
MAGDLYEQGYYETGTASITQGQTVVTGQGTAWSQIVRPADDFGKHVGMPIPIASVDSDTQITLAYPWPGPTQAAAPYRVTFTPYHVAYRQALQEIGRLLSSGNVLALAGLVGGADTLPFFDGTGTMDQTGLSAFMRTLMDAADAAAGRSTLGLGSSATQDVSAFATAAQGIKADNAQPALGYTPANKAGDTFTGPVAINHELQTLRPAAQSGDTFLHKIGWLGSEHFWWVFNSSAEMQLHGYSWQGNFLGTPLSITRGGDVTVGGTLAKGSGTFLIDHPLDPANRDLAHGFVEAPRYDLIYRGTVTLVDGRATVDIDAASNMSPGTFEALTTNAVVTALQNQSGFARLLPGAIAGGSFEIICEDGTCTDTVSWVVIAERNDPFVKHMDDNCDPAGRFIPEREKPE